MHRSTSRPGPTTASPKTAGLAGTVVRGAATLLLALAGLSCTVACNGAQPAADRNEKPETLALSGFYEPSGVAQLADGRLVVVEDEALRPFGLMTPAGSAGGFTVSRLAGQFTSDWLTGGLSDLEALAAGPKRWMYAITSHSRNANGKRASERERLLRFRVQGQGLRDLDVVADLRNAIVRAYPELEKASKERKVKSKEGLNIEGLAFDDRSGKLWIGLRAPLEGDRALLLAITNPEQVFARGGQPLFGSHAIELDLDGGGIRGLARAPALGGLLILSQRDTGKKERSSKLWLWDGESDTAPRRVRVRGVKDLGNAEGVAEVRLAGSPRVVLVFDDGDRKKKKPAGYLLADLSELDIEADGDPELSPPASK
ncbi:MAG: hypothetical protein O3A53_19070 [Acidobacteria bacterium]|nr:hypothetical protein [Acidobacteriota bacterium]MDA1236886.1 hypothetical protein [Acidobacteriota bacterium]